MFALGWRVRRAPSWDTDITKPPSNRIWLPTQGTENVPFADDICFVETTMCWLPTFTKSCSIISGAGPFPEWLFNALATWALTSKSETRKNSSKLRTFTFVKNRKHQPKAVRILLSQFYPFQHVDKKINIYLKFHRISSKDGQVANILQTKTCNFVR